jgi:heme-degrading monooxygenase HmoA
MIMRMILVSVPVEKAAEAERLWKNECAPLMIKQTGCISEQLLRGRENSGEFVSLSTWQDQASINRYRASDAHKTIEQRTRALMNITKVESKTYDIVQW